MTVYYAHVWYEHGAIQSHVLQGWQITSGPHDGAVLVYWPGDTGALPRVVAGGGWHSDRLSAELEVAERLRRIATAASDQAARITEGD